MVQRKSKYGTNRRISKNKQYIVDKKLQEVVGITKVDMANADYAKDIEEQAQDFGDEYYHKYKVWVDSSSFEQIDKKERKKLYRKAQDKEDEEDKEEEKEGEGEEAEDEGEGEEGEEGEEQNNADYVEDLWSGPSIRKRYSKAHSHKEKFLTRSEHAPHIIEDEYEEHRKRDREDNKKHKRVYEISGNPNHILNHIEGVKEFVVDPKQSKKYVEKGAGKKNCLYNGDYNVYHDKLDRKKIKMQKRHPDELERTNENDLDDN